MKRPLWHISGHSYFDEPFPIHVVRAQESFEWLDHDHDFIEICYVSEGAGVHYIEGAALNVSKGDLFYLPVGVAHVFRPSTPDPKRPLIVYNCLFAPELFAPLRGEEWFAAMARTLLDADRGWFRHQDAEGALAPLFKQLHHEANQRPEGYRALLFATVLRLLGELHRALQPAAADGAERAAPAEPRMERVAAAVRRDPGAALTAREAAAAAGVSERQFARLFRRHVGAGFLAFVQQERMELSCRLLREAPERRVPEIAAAAGYADLKFFNRLFKRYTGMTPREYRARGRDLPYRLPSLTKAPFFLPEEP